MFSLEAGIYMHVVTYYWWWIRKSEGFRKQALGYNFDDDSYSVHEL